MSLIVLINEKKLDKDLVDLCFKKGKDVLIYDTVSGISDIIGGGDDKKIVKSNLRSKFKNVVQGKLKLPYSLYGSGIKIEKSEKLKKKFEDWANNKENSRLIKAIGITCDKEPNVVIFLSFPKKVYKPCKKAFLKLFRQLLKDYKKDIYLYDEIKEDFKDILSHNNKNKKKKNKSIWDNNVFLIEDKKSKKKKDKNKKKKNKSIWSIEFNKKYIGRDDWPYSSI